MNKLDQVLEELRIIKAEQREHFEFLYTVTLAATGIAPERVNTTVAQHSSNIQERARNVR